MLVNGERLVGDRCSPRYVVTLEEGWADLSRDILEEFGFSLQPLWHWDRLRNGQTCFPPPPPAPHRRPARERSPVSPVGAAELG